MFYLALGCLVLLDGEEGSSKNYSLISYLERQDIGRKMLQKDRRIADPYVDRRSGENRRKVYDSEYWNCGGVERRKVKERRQQKERRSNFARVTEWSSVCIEK